MADFLDICLTSVSQLEFYRSEKTQLYQMQKKLRSRIDHLSTHLTRLALLREIETTIERQLSSFQGITEPDPLLRQELSLSSLLPQSFNICSASEILTPHHLCVKTTKFFNRLYQTPSFASFLVYQMCKPKHTASVGDAQKLFLKLIQIFSQNIYSYGVLPDDEKRLVQFHCDLCHRILSTNATNVRSSIKVGETFVHACLNELVTNCCNSSLKAFVNQWLRPLGLELLLDLLPFPRQSTEANFTQSSDSDYYAEMQQLFNAEAGVKLDEQKLMSFCHSVSQTLDKHVNALPVYLKTFFKTIDASLNECGVDLVSRRQFLSQLFVDRVLCVSISSLHHRMQTSSSSASSFLSSTALASIFTTAANFFRSYALATPSHSTRPAQWMHFDWICSGDSLPEGDVPTPTAVSAASGSYLDEIKLHTDFVCMSAAQLDFLMTAFRASMLAISSNIDRAFTTELNLLADVLLGYEQVNISETLNLPSSSTPSTSARVAGDSGCADVENSSSYRHQISFMGSVFLVESLADPKENKNSVDRFAVLAEPIQPTWVLKFDFVASRGARSAGGSTSGPPGGGGQASSNDSEESSESGGAKKKRSHHRNNQSNNQSYDMKDVESSKGVFESAVDRRDFDKIENAEISSVTSEKSTTKKLLRFDVPSSVGFSDQGASNTNDNMMDFASEAASVRSACSLDFDQDTDALSDLLLNEQVATRSEGGRSTPRSMITSDDGLLDSTVNPSAGSSANALNSATLRPPGTSNQRLRPAENISDKFGKFEIEKGPLNKCNARGDVSKDMRQSNTQSVVSGLGGGAVTGAGAAGDLQSDTWSVDAYASEEGSEPPPETTSVERLSEIMEDCELSGSLRATSLDIAVSRSSALSLASVTDENSSTKATVSSRPERRSVQASEPGDDESASARVDLNRSLDDETDADDALGAIGGLDSSLLHVMDDNNSDTWSVDVAASEFELNEEQRLDDFLEDQLLLGDDMPKGSHSRRGSRRAKKPHSQNNVFLSSHSASNYEDFTTIGMEDVVDDLEFADPNIGLAIPQGSQNSNLQNDRLTLLMNAEHDVPHSLQAESSLDVNLSSQISNAGSSVQDSGISGSMMTTLTISSMSSCLDSTGTSNPASNSRVSGGARPKHSSHYYQQQNQHLHQQHQQSVSSSAVNQSSGCSEPMLMSSHSHQQRVTVKSPPIDCLPKKKAKRIESISTHSSPLDNIDESAFDHRRSHHWFNDDTASSSGAGGQRSRNVSTGGVSTELMQQTSSVSNQDLHAAVSADDNVFLSPLKRRNDFKKMSEDLSFNRPGLAWADEVESSSLKGAGRLSQSEASDRFEGVDSNSLFGDFCLNGTGIVGGAHNSSSISLDVGGGGTSVASHVLSDTQPAVLPFSVSARDERGPHSEMKRCLSSLLLNHRVAKVLSSALVQTCSKSSNLEKMSQFLSLLSEGLSVEQGLLECNSLFPSPDLASTTTRTATNVYPFSSSSSSSSSASSSVPPSSSYIISQTAISLLSTLSHSACEKLMEEMRRDNESITAHNSHLMRSRRDLNVKLDLLFSRTHQLIALCIQVRSSILNKLCELVLEKFEGELRLAQEEVLSNSQEMSRQRVNLENMVLSFMQLAFPELSFEMIDSTNSTLRVFPHVAEESLGVSTSSSSSNRGVSTAGYMASLDNLYLPENLRKQLHQIMLRKFTESVFIGILFPCGSASFAKDRILFGTLSNLSAQLSAEACESLLGLPKKFTVGFPWPAAVNELSLISFQMICGDLVSCICNCVSILCSTMQLSQQHQQRQRETSGGNVSTDHLIPALMGVIIKTNPPLLFSIMEWLKCHELELLQGRHAFSVTTFIAAFEQIVQLFVVNQCLNVE